MASISAADVHAITFRKAPFGRRGYDEEEVDAFLEEVAATLASLETTAPAADRDFAVLAALDQIRTRLDRIETSVAARSGPTDPLYGPR